MSMAPENYALQLSYALCGTHRDALLEALVDLRLRSLADADLEHLSKDDRRLFDQFAYSYTRLQDDLGAKLMPAALRALGEEVSAMSVLDCPNRLEQLGWMPSADEWTVLRRIRNEFTHDYPETTAEWFSRLQLAIASARRALGILSGISQQIDRRFPELRP